MLRAREETGKGEPAQLPFCCRHYRAVMCPLQAEKKTARADHDRVFRPESENIEEKGKTGSQLFFRDRTEQVFYHIPESVPEKGQSGTEGRNLEEHTGRLRGEDTWRTAN